MPHTLSSKPKVLMIPDVPGWAFDITAKGLRQHLSNQFDISIRYLSHIPQFTETNFDIVHIFGERSTHHERYTFGEAKILKAVNGHTWNRYATADELYYRYMPDVHGVIVVNEFLRDELSHLPVPLFLFDQGVETSFFTMGEKREGPLVAGWAGKKDRPLKQFHFAEEACKGLCELRVAGGGLSQDEMLHFYHDIDILLSCSEFEGCPRPAIEAMSCGKFPVTFPIGVVPQVVTHKENGYLTTEKTGSALREGVKWCMDNLEFIRGQSTKNRDIICSTRDWSVSAAQMAHIYHALLAT